MIITQKPCSHGFCVIKFPERLEFCKVRINFKSNSKPMAPIRHSCDTRNTVFALLLK